MEIIRNTPVPTPLVPRLTDYTAPDGSPRHDITFLMPGDLFHFRADVFGADPQVPLFKKGSIVAAFGYCACLDLNGMVYQLRAYLPGHATTWAAREARRYPTAIQEEVCFTPAPEQFTELCLTDHAHALALERHEGAKVIPMYPTLAHAQRRVA